MSLKKNTKDGIKEEAPSFPTSRSKFATVRWFNPAPSASDRLWLEDNDDELVALFFTLLDSIQHEGRFTSKFDARSGRWLAILFVRSDSEGVELDAMSVRGATTIDAAILLAYFHLVKYVDGWELPSPESQGRWG